MANLAHIWAVHWVLHSLGCADFSGFALLARHSLLCSVFAKALYKPLFNKIYRAKWDLSVFSPMFIFGSSFVPCPWVQLLIELIGSKQGSFLCCPPNIPLCYQRWQNIPAGFGFFFFCKHIQKGKKKKKRTMQNGGVHADSLTLGSACLYFTYWIVNRFSSFVRDIVNDVLRPFYSFTVVHL